MCSLEYNTIFRIAIYIKIRNNIAARYPNCPIASYNAIRARFCSFNADACATRFIKYPLSLKFLKNII